MSVIFEVIRIGQAGQQEQICTTQSAREARELRDNHPGETLVVVHDGAATADKRRERAIDDSVDIEGDYLV
jgi:hypothetical protein